MTIIWWLRKIPLVVEVVASAKYDRDG